MPVLGGVRFGCHPSVSTGHPIEYRGPTDSSEFSNPDGRPDLLPRDKPRQLEVLGRPQNDGAWHHERRQGAVIWVPPIFRVLGSTYV